MGWDLFARSAPRLAVLAGGDCQGSRGFGRAAGILQRLRSSFETERTNNPADESHRALAVPHTSNR